ncbi:MAG: hypothetical protein JKY91_03570 [Emcibacter sp.]|nr:hypothetical protein [Emcibacter sp.]
MYRFFITLCLLSLPEMLPAADLQRGDVGFLCLKDSLHQHWPEFFAYKVEIIDGDEKRFKVRVVDAYAPQGRVNEEQTPVAGDIMKISKKNIHTALRAGITAGDRFDGKPVCKN